jgi:hypothetical protein
MRVMSSRLLQASAIFTPGHTHLQQTPNALLHVIADVASLSKRGSIVHRKGNLENLGHLLGHHGFAGSTRTQEENIALVENGAKFTRKCWRMRTI